MNDLTQAPRSFLSNKALQGMGVGVIRVLLSIGHLHLIAV